uniref:Uncharacterized protein n=1 Tax=Utricularia reniformis TaxID=192314 RepID=A0A1Y0B0V3_9LAMI|nr:hypothetical protein AEK19_MT0844 [Utricularia reniformis]YP_009382293.1 hypothetical protein AEK19_MT1865 [Utricularia reniformis]ART31075.1 hypothetical protein AEK19_MT0844 [Utricularia reniformis]ART32036.1 hypothetical protein AEK19_MT1865 [Utricularia reniformis]
MSQLREGIGVSKNLLVADSRGLVLSRNSYLLMEKKDMGSCFIFSFTTLGNRTARSRMREVGAMILVDK